MNEGCVQELVGEGKLYNLLFRLGEITEQLEKQSYEIRGNLDKFDKEELDKGPGTLTKEEASQPTDSIIERLTFIINQLEKIKNNGFKNIKKFNEIV
jgi:hypothetical protein